MSVRRTAMTLFVAAALLGSTAVAAAGVASASSDNTAVIPLLRVGLADSISTLDQSKEFDALDITYLCLETLMRLGPQGQLEPNLATSVSQPNPVTYVYHLRQGIKSWDGDELTSADVVYSWNHDRAPGSQAAYGFPSVLKSVAASGPYTVVVTLTRPDAAWRYEPAEGPLEVFEAKFAEAHKGTFGKPGVLTMGTGPWEVDSLDPTTGAELSANPNWWGGKVPFQHISFKFFSNETSEALAFRAGEIDLSPYILAPGSFAKTAGTTLLTAPSCDAGLFSMDTQAPPWNDVHVRRAVAYALDRTDIIAANGGYAVPNYTFIPPQQLLAVASQGRVNALLSSLNLYAYSIAKAKQEMAESAYPHGVDATMLGDTSGTDADVDQVIAAELQQVGIRVKLESDTGAEWNAVELGPASGRATTYFLAGCVTPDPSSYPATFLGPTEMQAGGYNFANYAPTAVDDLITAGVATVDPAKRFAIYTELLQNLATNVPYVSLYLYDGALALSKKFTFPGYGEWSTSGDYALSIKPAA